MHIFVAGAVGGRGFVCACKRSLSLVFILFFFCRTHSRRDTQCAPSSQPLLLFYSISILCACHFNNIYTSRIFIRFRSYKDRYVCIRSFMWIVRDLTRANGRFFPVFTHSFTLVFFYMRARTHRHYISFARERVFVCVHRYLISNSGNFVVLFSLNCFHNNFSPKNTCLNYIAWFFPTLLLTFVVDICSTQSLGIHILFPRHACTQTHSPRVCVWLCPCAWIVHTHAHE